MTPCEERGYKVGQVFKVVSWGDRTASSKIGDIIVLEEIDGTTYPWFRCINGSKEYEDAYSADLSNIVRIYPPEEKKPVETVELMGKTYNKAEIEQALRNIRPIKEV